VADLMMPRVEVVATAPNYRRFAIGPLEKGYGLILGNALRRILLSSLPGAAITSVRIEGVYHEFSTLPHVKEDVTEIVLNVKKLRLRSFSDRPVRLQLSAAGPGKVRASDIQLPSTVELINADQVLATLDSAEGRLEMELIVERGRGYVSSEMREGLPIGTIPVDAIFSPITRVNYYVEPTRVGQQTELDRLVIEIFTNGTLGPGTALARAAQIMTDYLALFREIEGQVDISQQEGLSAPASRVRDIKIDDLDFSNRTYNCLKRQGIETLEELRNYPEEELMNIRNFGSKSLEEVRDKLHEYGFELRRATPEAEALEV